VIGGGIGLRPSRGTGGGPGPPRGIIRGIGRAPGLGLAAGGADAPALMTKKFVTARREKEGERGQLGRSSAAQTLLLCVFFLVHFLNA